MHTIHLGVANALKSDLIAISKEEAAAYATAVTRVTELYDVRLLPEKQMAWINLFMVMGGIYGPRVMASSMRKAQKKKQPSNVVDMPAPQVSGVI